MKTLLIALGVIVAAIAAAVAALAAYMRTGIDALDGLRSRVAWALLKRGIADPRYARSMMAIAHNEAPARWDGVSPIVGDATLGGGPSVGPFQVYRSTAKALGLWACPPDITEGGQDERDAYASVANDLDKCTDMGVAVFLDKLDAAGGDFEDAVRRYNGGGAAAQAYKARAVAFAADQGWDLNAPGGQS